MNLSISSKFLFLYFSLLIIVITHSIPQSTSTSKKPIIPSPTPKSTLQSLGGIRFFLYRDPEFQADAYELIVYRDDCLKLPGPIANLVRSVKTDGCIWLWERNTCEGARRLACPQFSENKDLGKITYQNRVSAVSIAPGQTSN